MKSIRLHLLPWLLILLAGCGGGSSPGTGGGGAPAVSQILLSPTPESVKVGEEKSVVVHVMNQSGEPVDVQLTWSVADPSIASVTSDGKIKGLKVGQTTLAASYQAVQSNTVEINVLSSTQPASITIDNSPGAILVGANKDFTAVVKDASGQVIDVVVSWRVADPGIASVSSDGRVTGLKEGETTLTALFEGVESNPVPIQVSTPSNLPVDSVKINTAAAPSIQVGSTFPFTATALDRLGREVGNVEFTWTVSDNTIASVDSTGTVTAKKAGNADLTASVKEIHSPSIHFTVVEAPATPQIVGVNPGANGVTTPEGNPTGTFNTVIDPTSLQAGFTVQSAAGPVPGTVRCNTPCKTATFTPGSLLAEGSYTATFSTDVKSDKGIALASPFTWTFSVKARVVATCQPAPRGTNGWETIRGQQAIQDLWGVHFVNECEGWAVGMEMTLSHTIDGGVTWERQTNVIWKDNNVPQIPPDFYDVFFLDANTGWATGWPEIVLATTDGGATWREQRRNAAYTQDVCTATDPTTGACTRKNWCDQPDPDNPKSCLGKKSGVYLRRIRFADPQNGWVVGRFGTLYRTVNGGATWTDPPQKPLNPVPCLDGSGTQRVKYTPHWFGLDVISSQEIWIGGGWDDGSYCSGWNRAIIHTLDGGASWIYQNDHPSFGGLEGSGRYQDLHFIGNFGWAVGEAGTILRTVDHGAKWERITGTGAGGALLWGLSFIDPMNVWITGTNGVIVHTGNANAPTRSEILWTKQVSGTGTQLRRSSFVNPSFGWIAGQFRLFRTTTGGDPLPAGP